jgi:Mannosyl-glycoprotein endo-beta-N-acetylglucosaminidase/CHAP domain
MPDSDPKQILEQGSRQQLSGSVGQGGKNRPEDVRLVQQLIEDHLPHGLMHLEVTGNCDKATIDAIVVIQHSILGIESPDGKVDPNGPTFRTLINATPVPKGHPGPPFPEDVIAAAKTSHAKWTIPASVTLAQWALESSWGRKMPSGSNNPFGIKAAAGQPFVEAITREHINGEDRDISARFRKFESIADAFDEHGKLLHDSPRYEHARTVVNDPDAFADALTGVYATDPNYGTHLKKLMRDHNLYQYDAENEKRSGTENEKKTTHNINELVEIARKEIGTEEDPKHQNKGSSILKYQQSTNLSGQGWPRCAAFVDWCVQQFASGGDAKIAHVPRTAAAWGLISWGIDNHYEVFNPPVPLAIGADTKNLKPRPGDIVIYEFYHTGIVSRDGDSGHDFYAIEGNTNPGGGRDGYEVAERGRSYSLVKKFIRLPA